MSEATTFPDTPTTTPLLEAAWGNGGDDNNNDDNAAAAVATGTFHRERSFRNEVFDFLQAKTSVGRWYEGFTIVLIVASMLTFIVGSLFVEEYNPGQAHLCNDLCDALWFGNRADNPVVASFWPFGATSVLELLTIAVFSVDYLLQLWTADLEHCTYQGVVGRLRFGLGFYSLVDLASILPFYVDAFCLPNTDLAASQFLRMFRLFRMLRVEGRNDMAFAMLQQVFVQQAKVLGTAAFVGMTLWVTVSGLYYLAERENTDMIDCPTCGVLSDTSLCTFDRWGFVNCTAAGCPPTPDEPQPCYNLYQSIPLASYYTLLNLLGEFPHVDQHSIWGKVVGTFVAVVAVAFFALPAGIIGNGFETVIRQRCEEEAAAANHDDADAADTEDSPVAGNESTIRGCLYNFLHGQTTRAARLFDHGIHVLIVLTALAFMVDTVSRIPFHGALNALEWVSVLIFTIEYILRVYSAGEHPRYAGGWGRWLYTKRLLPLVDLLSFLPFWVAWAVGGTRSSSFLWVKCLRLFRLLRMEKYTHAFSSFRQVWRTHGTVLSMTGFTALILWVFFGAILYFTERNNPRPEMARFYNTVPNAMWITLLNLSGESPLSEYTVWGKIVTGIVGLFATAFFGIPIGVLGAGFEQLVEEQQTPPPQEEQEEAEAETEAEEPTEEGTATTTTTRLEETATWCSSTHVAVHRFVHGRGSRMATAFEVSIYVLIVATVTVGIIQTVPQYANTGSELEWFAVTVFTVEYLLRLYSAPANPDMVGSSSSSNCWSARLRFVVSFYSIVDLLAILPFYLAVAMPGTWVDRHDEYLRMFRLLRLLKLDKYVASMALLGQVMRLKRDALIIAGCAAGTLWILFAALLYVTQHDDMHTSLDGTVLPQYGCYENCTMANRFQNYFDSLVYTGVHLTGDYPIITYNWPARFLNFFMVIAAVGVVSVPSGLIASGFAEIVQSKAKAQALAAAAADGSGDGPEAATVHSRAAAAGDDWYDIQYRALEGQPPPLSSWGPCMDEWQQAIHDFLNGKQEERAGGESKAHFTAIAFAFRVLMFVLIVVNVVAVIVESVPEIDRRVGNEAGNVFDVLEALSVFVFAGEYLARLVSAPKNRQALYSSWVYATTFFGLVDLLSTAPWFVEQLLLACHLLTPDSNATKLFRLVRLFRILQLEDFVVAFRQLDNVVRACQTVWQATGLVALVVWVASAALFFLAERDNANWRTCAPDIPHTADDGRGCWDFGSTQECNDAHYDGACQQTAFTSIPNALFFVAIFLVGDWGFVDFTGWGRGVCLVLCVVGIALYAIPVGTLFDSFGAVLGMTDDDDGEEEGEEEEEEGNVEGARVNEERTPGENE